MYHRIATEEFDPWGLAVEPDRFAEQLGWLAHNREVLPLGEFAGLQAEGRLPKRAVALTFDDGYACAASVAAPLLEREGVPATVFLPAGLIDTGREFWWDELAQLILDFQGSSVTMLGQAFEMPPAQEADKRWVPGRRPSTPRQKLFRDLWSELRRLDTSRIDTALAEIRSQAGADAPARESHRPMTGEEIRSRNGSVIEFGAHAFTHPSLPSLGSNEKDEEIRSSLEACARLSGKRPRSFAYPYGDVDRESIRLVQEAGFDCACTTRQAFVSRTSDAFALPRIAVGNWNLRQFADRLGGE